MNRMNRWMLCCGFYALCLLLPGLSSTAHAAEITDVADSFDYENKNPFDFRIKLSYELFSESANIYREKAHPTSQYFCYGKDNGCQNPAEFSMSHIRHSMNINLTIGLYKDLELFVNLPLILYESVASRITPDAVQTGSSLRADGIVAADQMESRHTTVLGDMALGFQWGIFNDYRDKTLATWVIGFKWTIPTGTMWNPLKYKPDATNPSILTEGGVGRGAHQLTWHVALSKRLMFADPYIKIHYTIYLTPDDKLREELIDPAWLAAQRALQTQLQQDAAKATDQQTRESLTKRANDKSTFINNALKNSLSLIHEGGFQMGSEFVFWEDTINERKIFLDLRFVLVAVFQGRRSTPFADMLAGYKPNVTEGGQQVPERASLLTDVEDAFTLYFQPALHFRVSKYGYFRIEGRFGTTMPFALTRAKRGTDLNKSGFVDLQTDEVYPFHVRSLDGVGKRIYQRDTLLMSLLIYGGLTF